MNLEQDNVTEMKKRPKMTFWYEGNVDSWNKEVLEENLAQARDNMKRLPILRAMEGGSL